MWLIKKLKSGDTAKYKERARTALLIANERHTNLELLIEQKSKEAEGLDAILTHHFAQKASQVDAILDIFMHQLRTATSKLSKPLYWEESRASLARRTIDSTLKPNKSSKAIILHASKMDKMNITLDFDVNMYRCRLHYHDIGCINFGFNYENTLKISTGLYPIYRNMTGIHARLKSVGEWPENNAHLSRPFGIAIHPITGNVYVATRTHHSVFVLSPSLDFILRFGSCEKGPQQLSNPESIAVSADGKFVAVADYARHNIKVFDAEGTFIMIIGKPGSKDGDLKYPGAVAYDWSGCLYVSDTENNRIQKFDQGGKYVLTFLTPEIGGSLGTVCGVACLDNESILVSYHDTSDVKLFSTDGKHLSTYPIGSAREDSHVFRASNGGFGVVCYHENVIELYDNDGEMVNSIQVRNPRSAAFGLDGRFYVSIHLSNMIAIY